MMYSLSDYNYDLPPSYIAQIPAEPADSAKLLIPSIDGNFIDKRISDLPDIVDANDVLFFNDTRVVQARIPLYNTRVVTRQGREVLAEYAEIFFLEKYTDTTCEALITLLKRNRPGTKIYISDSIIAEIIALTDKGVMIEFQGITIDELMKQYGQMPLPPYIATTPETAQKYQTIFAKHDGSVAAPTASLHFTPDVLGKLDQRGVQIEYVTLHVGLGTFKPVDTVDIRDYHIHEETIIIDKALFGAIAGLKAKGKNIVAVGTTVSRVLETLPYIYRYYESIEESDEGQVDVIMGHKLGITNYELRVSEYRNNLTKDITPADTQKYILDIKHIGDNKLQIKTRIFIYPGFEWKVVDSLVTNFHLPGSTLLMLVASFMGYENMKKLYEYAIAHEYRFFSFGDAMLLKKQ